jgi:hypothetical protein
LTYTKKIAVRSDGSVATLTRWEHSKDHPYFRDVIDAALKRNVIIDPVTKTVVEQPYNDVQVLHPGLCEGKAAGQIEGFDVVYTESTQTIQDGSIATEKKWNAPKLGCYSVRSELIDIHNGEMMFDATHSLVNIHLGDPDPWYFSIPTDYTVRTKAEWSALITPLIKAGVSIQQAQ